MIQRTYFVIFALIVSLPLITTSAEGLSNRQAKRCAEYLRELQDLNVRIAEADFPPLQDEITLTIGRPGKHKLLALVKNFATFNLELQSHILQTVENFRFVSENENALEILIQEMASIISLAKSESPSTSFADIVEVTFLRDFEKFTPRARFVVFMALKELVDENPSEGDARAQEVFGFNGRWRADIRRFMAVQLVNREIFSDPDGFDFMDLYRVAHLLLSNDDWLYLADHLEDINGSYLHEVTNAIELLIRHSFNRNQLLRLRIIMEKQLTTTQSGPVFVEALDIYSQLPETVVEFNSEVVQLQINMVASASGLKRLSSSKPLLNLGSQAVPQIVETLRRIWIQESAHGPAQGSQLARWLGNKFRWPVYIISHNFGERGLKVAVAVGISLLVGQAGLEIAEVGDPEVVDAIGAYLNLGILGGTLSVASFGMTGDMPMIRLVRLLQKFGGDAQEALPLLKEIQAKSKDNKLRGTLDDAIPKIENSDLEL